MGTKTWRAEWNGHQIELENWWTVGLLWNSTGMRLFIDGECVDEQKSSGFLFAGRMSFRGVVRGRVEHEGHVAVVRGEAQARLFTVRGTIDIDGERLAVAN